MASVDWSVIVGSMLGWWISSGICAAVQVWYQGVSGCLLPRCPSKPSFVSIVVVPSIWHMKRGIMVFFIAGLSVCLTPTKPLATISSPQLEWALFCLHETICVLFWTMFSFTWFILEEQERELYLESSTLFSQLFWKHIGMNPKHT